MIRTRGGSRGPVAALDDLVHVNPDKKPDFRHVFEVGPDRKIPGRPQITDQRVKTGNVLVRREDGWTRERQLAREELHRRLFAT